MNLAEQLLKIDKSKAEELAIGKVNSQRLAKLLGVEKAEITIQEVPPRRMKEIQNKQFNKKGKFDLEKSFDAQAILLTEGIIEPSMKDETLMKHFGCATPKELVIKLFGNEIGFISDKITDISGIDPEEEEELEEEIKN